MVESMNMKDNSETMKETKKFKQGIQIMCLYDLNKYNLC